MHSRSFDSENAVSSPPPKDLWTSITELPKSYLEDSLATYIYITSLLVSYTGTSGHRLLYTSHVLLKVLHSPLRSCLHIEEELIFSY